MDGAWGQGGIFELGEVKVVVVDIYVCVRTYVRTLLSIYMSKSDCIYYQNFSMKTKFIIGFFIYNYYIS